MTSWCKLVVKKNWYCTVSEDLFLLCLTCIHSVSSMMYKDTYCLMSMTLYKINYTTILSLFKRYVYQMRCDLYIFFLYYNVLTPRKILKHHLKAFYCSYIMSIVWISFNYIHIIYNNLVAIVTSSTTHAWFMKQKIVYKKRANFSIYFFDV